MARVIEAVYANGVLQPLTLLALTDGQVIRLTIHDDVQPELDWLARKGSSYAGQWVGLRGDQVIAHGYRLADVRKTAREAGVENPFLVSVPDDSLPFGGW
jgi:predicted DNA-binding antitoxin AbrB/MazE fold protein